MFKEKKTEPKEIKDWLKKISEQLERLIICQEKRISGEVIKDFNSKQHLNKEV